MDDEQRKYFATLMASMEGVAADSRSAASTSREAAQAVRNMEQAVRSLDQRVSVTEKHVSVLHSHVFGKPPTSQPPGPMRPVAESIGEHDGEIAALGGQMIAARSEIAAVKAQNEVQLVLMRKLVAAAGHPMVRRVAWALGALIVAYATAKGLVLK